MEYEKNDVNELYKSVGIKTNSYIEIKENEAVIKIKKKWLLVDQIISFYTQHPVKQQDKVT